MKYRSKNDRPGLELYFIPQQKSLRVHYLPVNGDLFQNIFIVLYNVDFDL